MKIQIMSDLHHEFHKDQGVNFVKSLDPTDVDVLVVAGDLGNSVTVCESLRMLCDRYPVVLYVIGNHEYYGSDPERVKQSIRTMEAKLKNLEFLDNDVFEYKGKSFAGTTLWFPDHPMNTLYEKSWSDFIYIKGLKPWVYSENRKAVSFLKEQAPKVDMVITHYMPSEQCVMPRWKGNDMNRFFVCPVAETLSGLPKFWVYGHGHDANRITLGECEFIVNPLGYPFEKNVGYQQKLVLELP